MTRARGTRSPAPHQAKISTSGSWAATAACVRHRAGITKKTSAGRRNQLCHPALRVNKRFAPLFAVDRSRFHHRSLRLGGRDRADHFLDHRLGPPLRVEDVPQETDVLIDVGQRMGRQGENWNAALQDGGQGFQPVGNGREHQVGRCREDFFRVRGPRIRDDFQIAFAQSRDRLQAITGAGDQRVEAAQMIQRKAHAWLQCRHAQTSAGTLGNHAGPGKVPSG